jgi:hypothetical protein
VTPLQDKLAHGVRADDMNLPQVAGPPGFVPESAVSLRSPRPETA